MKTIFDYTQSHVLIIPQALFAMQDVIVLKQHLNSVIFYKCIEHDLLDIEFYTNTPCFIYIESGYEEIINSNNEVIGMRAGSGIFLPQGLNLHSDFVKKTEALKAYLVFFEQEVIDDYLQHMKRKRAGTKVEQNYCLVNEDEGQFSHFFQSIKNDITAPDYLRVKLLELLHLIAWHDCKDIFIPLLLSMKTQSPKRNLVRLLEKTDILSLTVNDLAHISGRSLSSFNRDFKALYHTSPKKWLQERRLARAKELLNTEQLSVTQVASEVGYENVSNFIKAFKIQYGITPKKIKSS